MFYVWARLLDDDMVVRDDRYTQQLCSDDFRRTPVTRVIDVEDIYSITPEELRGAEDVRQIIELAFRFPQIAPYLITNAQALKPRLDGARCGQQNQWPIALAIEELQIREQDAAGAVPVS